MRHYNPEALMSTARKNKTKYIFIEILAICFFASNGLFVRHSTLSSINVGLWRMLLALPFLFVMAFKYLKKLKLKDILLMLVCGACLAGDIIFFNYSLTRTTMANSNLIANLTSFVIVPVSYFIFKEKIPKYYLVGLIIAIIGVVILILGKANPSKSNYIGDLLAGVSCIFYASYLLFSYRLRDRIESSAIMFVGSIGSIIVLAIAASFTGGIQAPSSIKEFCNLLGLALSMQVVGHTLFGYCQGMVSANLSSAVTLLQPAVAAVFSFLMFSERLTMKEILGMIIVIIGVYICKRQYDSKK